MHDLSRREFLAASGAAALAATRATGAAAPAAPPPDVLILVFATGGLDGLTAVAPYGDQALYAHRPNLAVRPPGQQFGAIDLDGFFGLAPAAAPLLSPYSNGHLAVVHATGSPAATLSHFESQRLIEVGAPSTTAQIQDGWVARHIAATPPVGAGNLRAMSIGHLTASALLRSPATLPIPDPASFAFPGAAQSAAGRRALLEDLYADADDPLRGAASSTFEGIDLLNSLDLAGYVPEHGASYPATGFGAAMRNTAALLKAEIGLECIHVTYGGWDHHAQMGPFNGILAQMLDRLSRTLEAFYVDTQNQLSRYTLVVLSEFGRRVPENGSFGTDHGEGNCMFVMGGSVRGGQVMTQWPGLGNLGNGNLPITIDYRDVLGELVAKRLRNSDVGPIFPDFTPTFRGLFV
ncbi:MAG: DUF1501 domain-containing protein [bacterium]|nr:DUF1501 domain-containing protein [bacterium]